jgi:hypothetical protein
MSAELLRDAATKMRQEAEAVRRPYARSERVAVAVADWLESEAGYVEHNLDTDITTSHAVAVARAYLGEVAS